MSSPKQIQNFRAQAKTAFAQNRRIAFYDIKHGQFRDDMKIHEFARDGFVVQVRGKLRTVLFENLALLEVL